MNSATGTDFDPQLDLRFERIVDVPREKVWQAWTIPQQLMQWFTPVPWRTMECEIDLRPGGIFRTVMRSPEGQDFPNVGCYLEVLPNTRLVWTNMLEGGFRPSREISGCPGETFGFTGIIELAAQGSGTRYAATVKHGSEDGRKRHADMGFHDGWGKALDQLVAMIRRG